METRRRRRPARRGLRILAGLGVLGCGEAAAVARRPALFPL
ncbi:MULTISPECIES: hypothetical protein [unclassified Streptomyces]